jgi:uncharacterized protein YdhG (YjbR/CyaY superfamily)
MAEKKTTSSFTAAERQAMKDRANEAKRAATGAADLEAFMKKVKEMPKAEREITLRLKELVAKNAPELVAKTWYGMPAFYSPGKTGKVIIFFQNAAKFKTRFSTLGFSEHANLDEGSMWPTSFALLKLTPKVETLIKALIKQSVSK